MNDKLSELLLTQHLFAKFFHDLSGALSAVNSGIEYLDSLDTKTRDRAMKLLSHGSSKSIETLEFFRKAYGASNQNGEANLEEIEQLCINFTKDSKIDLEFQIESSYRPEVFTCINTGRIILCLVAIASEALVYGGKLKVRYIKTDDDKKIIVTASDDRVRVNKANIQILSSKNKDAANVTYMNAHYYYTCRILEAMKSDIIINTSDDLIEYIVR